jgi:hypothetical protein
MVDAAGQSRTLELPRDGHAVTGIDLSADSIEVAERSKVAHPDTPGFGSLHCLCTEVNTWQTSAFFSLSRTVSRFTEKR